MKNLICLLMLCFTMLCVADNGYTSTHIYTNNAGIEIVITGWGASCNVIVAGKASRVDIPFVVLTNRYATNGFTLKTTAEELQKEQEAEQLGRKLDLLVFRPRLVSKSVYADGDVFETWYNPLTKVSTIFRNGEAVVATQSN